MDIKKAIEKYSNILIAGHYSWEDGYIHNNLSDYQIFKINVCDNRGLVGIRNFIKTFLSYKTDKLKVVLIYDAHELTEEAQNAYRRIMEIYSSSTRFILFSNNMYKLTNAIISRCYVINLDKKELEKMNNTYEDYIINNFLKNKYRFNNSDYNYRFCINLVNNDLNFDSFLNKLLENIKNNRSYKKYYIEIGSLIMETLGEKDYPKSIPISKYYCFFNNLYNILI